MFFLTDVILKQCFATWIMGQNETPNSDFSRALVRPACKT